MADQPGNASFDPSAWEPSNRTAPLSVIWSLLGRHIAFHRRLVDLTDNVKAALLLSQSIYWALQGINETTLNPGGSYFHLIDAVQPPQYLGRDPERERLEWRQNFQVDWENPAT